MEQAKFPGVVSIIASVLVAFWTHVGVEQGTKADNEALMQAKQSLDYQITKDKDDLRRTQVREWQLKTVFFIVDETPRDYQAGVSAEAIESRFLEKKAEAELPWEECYPVDTILYRLIQDGTVFRTECGCYATKRG